MKKKTDEELIQLAKKGKWIKVREKAEEIKNKNYTEELLYIYSLYHTGKYFLAEKRIFSFLLKKASTENEKKVAHSLLVSCALKRNDIKAAKYMLSAYSLNQKDKVFFKVILGLLEEKHDEARMWMKILADIDRELAKRTFIALKESVRKG